MSLPNVPPHLTIRILYSDENVVAIDKPCDLRSVPGHANPPPLEKKRPRQTGTGACVGEGGGGSRRMTSQEAWVKAIQLLSADEGTCIPSNRSDGNSSSGEISMEEAAAEKLLRNLGSTANPACVPRKFETFVKYCHRNSKRLLPSFSDLHDSRCNVESKKEREPTQKKQKCDKSSQQSSKGNALSIMRIIAEIAYAKIQSKQQPLMNLPKPTEDFESAIGQLRMLGFGDHSNCAPATTKGGGHNSLQTNVAKLHVVHRLDCQTSGIMLVARNRSAASTLCKAWRERGSVQKVYLAHVRHWPPYHKQKVSEGTIDIPLAPSRTERIKWESRPLSEGGKECETYWKVHEDLDNITAKNDEDGASQDSPIIDKRGIILELHPITGRTHQLRIHCAAIGSGIVGDSLYGDSPIAWIGDDTTTRHIDEKPGVNAKTTAGTELPNTLRLHAHKLTYPDPNSGEKVTLDSPKIW